ncbi:BnaA04g21180D [Brassica napus]|uniref:BnaA04g21180D protein n=1 Tax=Brassica napus TaxID=3708 RepID=A0A078FZ45_BRANA|nr:BnaA04g21180D [Brassica napus]
MSRLPLALHLFGDDEDTHDAFSFQKNRLAGSSKLANVASPGGGEPSHLVEATSGDEGPYPLWVCRCILMAGLIRTNGSRH